MCFVDGFLQLVGKAYLLTVNLLSIAHDSIQTQLFSDAQCLSTSSAFSFQIKNLALSKCYNSWVLHNLAIVMSQGFPLSGILSDPNGCI